MGGVDRLYYRASGLLEFDAQVVRSSDDSRRIYLDRTAFYPTSGGQPYDTGTLNGIAIEQVIDEEEQIAHVLAAPLLGGTIHGLVDPVRRHDHMQQHSGQHLLSAILADRFGVATVGFHLGAETSTIDLDSPSLDAIIDPVQEVCRQEIAANHPVRIVFEEASSAQRLRKAPAREGIIRVIEIGSLDRSACGGTHVESTGQIGTILLRGTEKVRGGVRLQFVCGLRAARRARLDFELLDRTARAFSATFEDVPALAASQRDRLAASDKTERRLLQEIASLQGAGLYHTTPPGADGIRRVGIEQDAGPVDEGLRALALAFTAKPDAMLTVLTREPGSVLVAISKGSRYDAQAILKPLLAECGGRGGGSATLAQGSLPGREEAALLGQKLRAALGF